EQARLQGPRYRLQRRADAHAARGALARTLAREGRAPDVTQRHRADVAHRAVRLREPAVRLRERVQPLLGRPVELARRRQLPRVRRRRAGPRDRRLPGRVRSPRPGLPPRAHSDPTARGAARGDAGDEPVLQMRARPLGVLVLCSTCAMSAALTSVSVDEAPDGSVRVTTERLDLTI